MLSRVERRLEALEYNASNILARRDHDRRVTSGKSGAERNWMTQRRNINTFDAIVGLVHPRRHLHRSIVVTATVAGLVRVAAELPQAVPAPVRWLVQGGLAM